MTVDRRRFLAGAGLGAFVKSAGCRTAAAPAGDTLPHAASWSNIRDEFPLSRDHIHLALMLLTSHPRTVREAIEHHRRRLDENPTEYFEEQFFQIEARVREAAASYMGGSGDDVALTDSTTMGLGVLYSGLAVREGQEIVTTTHDHYATHEALRARAARAGGKVTVRKIPLYDRPEDASEEEVTDRLLAAIGPRTTVVAVTWVHSSTGVKLPIQRFAAALAALNQKRDPQDRVLLCVDGVHGFGVESERPADLGCDFFSAGCHKWMFGPRGTGVLWGRPEAWKGHVGLIPPFERAPYEAWMKGEDPTGPPGPMATPGGFHSFEHRWALGEAFAFHQSIGRARITARIHDLARQCKEGLRAMPHVAVKTPLSGSMSSALVCFEVKGLSAEAVIARLKERKIIASVTPYTKTYARFSPGILNTPEEIETALRAVRALA